MTRHTTDDDSGTGSTTTRRGYLRLGLGAGAAAAGIAAGSSPAQAQASLIGSALGQNRGLHYLIGQKIEDVKDHFNNLNDASTYDGIGARSLYLQARSDGQTMQAQNALTLTQLENLIQNAKSACYQIGRASVLEQINNGTDPLNTLQQANSEMADYIVPNQKNLIERWNIAVTQIETAFNEVQANPNLTVGEVWQRLRVSDSGSEFTESGFDSVGQASVTLADGSTTDYWGLEATNSNGGPRGVDPYNNLDGYDYDYSLQVKPDPEASGSSAIMALPTERFQALHGELETIYNEAVNEIDTFVQGIKDSYNAGDISTEDIATPRDLWAMSSEDADAPYAAADLAGLGLEVNQKSSVVIHLLDEDTKLEGSVYLSESPIGESLTSRTVYDPGLNRSTDSDGNHTDSASDYAGTESDPIPLDGLTFIAYNTDSGSTYGQIKQPFKVQSIFGEDGQELQSATYEPSTGQQTTTTDIDELRSELKSLNEEIVELEEEKREIATGGGGGGGGGSDLGTLVAAAAGGGLLLALLTGGGGS